ncbi:TIGR01457 family HAD-type hydrolase [Paenibacillus yanchengensis]|uniref:Acid sugar phosphatase n=1 Tax=Paenibacillus yanchengensis TaxID=2035833 RepID=A0ABW4YQG7_9BACL
MTTKIGFLIDLDGTMYHGGHPIEGAPELIAYMHKQQIPYRFVTNNSSLSAALVAEKLNEMNIIAEPSHVCTSADATAAYIAKRQPEAKVFVVGEQGLHTSIALAGLHISNYESMDEVDFVVQGIDRQFTYEKLAKAVQLIRNGAVSIMTNPDRLLPSDHGFIPGAGSLGAMIETASGVKPLIIGKPSSILMDFAIATMDVDNREQLYVVGDNLATDIAAGYAAGCKTILVYTGLTTPENYEHYAQDAGYRPHEIYNNLLELKQWLEV